MIRVLLADDHAIVRSGLRLLIEGTSDLRVAGEAADGRELLRLAESIVWDVLLLDLSLPRVGGLEALRRLREQKPGCAVVVLSMYPEEQYALRMIQEGASAYLSKERPAEEILAAIRKVARGGTYLTEAVTDQMLRSPTKADKLPHEALTAREYQVFLLVIQGRSGVEIAAELDLTPSTVSTHVKAIKEKLSARTVAEIVSYAHRAGLVG